MKRGSKIEFTYSIEIGDQWDSLDVIMQNLDSDGKLEDYIRYKQRRRAFKGA